MKLNLRVYLRTKFQVSSIILTSFRRVMGMGVILPPTTPKQTPKKFTQTRVKGKLLDFKQHKSSHSLMFFKVDALKNFVIFTGNHLC